MSVVVVFRPCREDWGCSLRAEDGGAVAQRRSETEKATETKHEKVWKIKEHRARKNDAQTNAKGHRETHCKLQRLLFR